MHGLLSSKGICLGLILAGVGLMSVAMFLHPMSPRDFLLTAVSDPLQTLADTEGGLAALFFWASTLVFLIGSAGLMARLFASLRRNSLRLPSHPRVPIH